MTKMIRRTEPTEHEIQSGVVEWASITKIPGEDYFIKDFLIAIPNGGRRNKIMDTKGKWFSLEGKRFKKEGVKPGVSDLFLALPFKVYSIGGSYTGWYEPKRYNGLWMEAKTRKGKLSKFQKDWMEKMKFAGYLYVVFRSVDEGVQAIENYLGMK